MFHSFTTVPDDLKQRIVDRADGRLTKAVLETCCQVTHPIVVDGALTKITIQGIADRGVQGTRDYLYSRFDLGTHFKGISIAVDLGPVPTLVKLLNQLHERIGVLFELTDLVCDFTVNDAGHYTVNANPTSYAWVGSIKVKSAILLPKIGIREYNAATTKVGAMSYSWNLDFTEYALFSRFNKRTDLVTLSHILQEVTGDPWVCTAERASWNLWQSEVVSDGPHDYIDRTGTHCLIIKLHSEYCESIAGYLYLFYTPHQGIK